MSKKTTEVVYQLTNYFFFINKLMNEDCTNGYLGFYLEGNMYEDDKLKESFGPSLYPTV